jgi:hypothetical protein
MMKAVLQLGWGTVVDRVALEQIFCHIYQLLEPGAVSLFEVQYQEILLFQCYKDMVKIVPVMF